MNIPHVPNALVEYLDRLYPASKPDINASDRVIWSAYGRRDVVEQLHQMLKDQEAGDDSTEGLPNVFPQRPGSPAGAADPSPGSASATAARTAGSTGNRLGG